MQVFLIDYICQKISFRDSRGKFKKIKIIHHDDSTIYNEGLFYFDHFLYTIYARIPK